MENLNINIPYQKFASFEDLPEKHQILWKEALEARKSSYSPYSNFTVGSAIELENGEIITGTNQENAAFPAGLCAERVAMYRSGIQAPEQKFVRMAICATKGKEENLRSAPPCGGCRQVMLEFEKRHQQSFELLFTDANGDFILINSPSDLFPFSFVF
ncbi:cytidine deaminase [Marivirga lumbricoides]|uniref:Cytidine deaminase n=1 Tax=Marivirga lumbricoides TaxID=1046115 RepID=A0ABQ1MPF0_9BACT|nr:cytidine deaminase [Marivirga lumbricoides]